MIDIWTEFARFKTTDQRFADQVRTITKRISFLTLNTGKSINIFLGTNQKTPNTVTDILITGKLENPN